MARGYWPATRDGKFFQLSTLFRALAFLVAACSLTWVGVLWWWQRIGLNPQLSDLLLYLGLLPLVLLALLLGLRWAWQHRKALALPGAAVAEGAVASTNAVPPDATSVAARQAVLQIVQVHAHSVAGEEAADLLEAAASGKPIPQPDSELRHEDGLPVVCARIADKGLAPEALRARLMTLLPSVRPHSGGTADEQPLSDNLLRALAALEPVLEAQRDGLMSIYQAGLGSLSGGGASVAGLPNAQRPVLPGLSVLMGWPVHWTNEERLLARAWVENCLRDREADLSSAYALTFISWAGSGEELWLRADQVAHAPGLAPWLLVLGCESDVDPARISSLAAAHRLYDAALRPGGCMPGEAAAALLLAPASWARPAGANELRVRIHRPALLRRDRSVESAGRVTHVDVAQAVEQALMAAQLTAADLGMLVCDADLHSSRGGELYGMAVEALPQLDPLEDMRLLGRVTGRTGVASALLVLAAAAEAVKSLKKPTLALTLADPHLRMAVVLKPQETHDDATS